MKGKYMSYVCQTPVVLIIFNRPNFAQLVFNEVKKVKPKKLFIISDGVRNGNKDDINKVKQCRDIVDAIDWECDVIKLFSDKNLGCKKRVMSGLDIVFESVEKAIILEDDCVPTVTFFKFCEWGLNKYESNNQIGIISGSNLIDFKQSDVEIDSLRAGFSSYINCWGWATWKRTWSEFDSYLTIQEINRNKNLFNKTNLNSLEKLFWLNVFKHSVYSSTIWDFYLQYIFYANSYLSIFPKYNLVKNIGFDNNSTHTINMPEFVAKSLPIESRYENLMDLNEPAIIEVDHLRDKNVLRIIYGYSEFATFKLILGNNLRYNGII